MYSTEPGKHKSNFILSNYQFISHADSPHYNSGVNPVFIDDNAVQLSNADRRSYEKVFSSIIVPYTALTIGKEIGRGECEGMRSVRV